jgi:hypothetical protein
MTGEAASKLFPFMLDLSSDRGSGRWSVSGTHDGYPPYVANVDGVLIYNYQQGHIGHIVGVATLRNSHSLSVSTGER